ncbi:MAG: beta-propeller fold lactonase family protein [Nitrososphaerota archaeon]|jgi:YVTN family beta-propeller protein|nr:beta-propeller fold lactonase family protein [Nitrososphaerota archaeon]
MIKKVAFVVFLVSAFLLCSCLFSELAVAQKTVDTITGLSMPFQVAVNPNGVYTYVTCGGTGSVWVVDTATNEVSSKITGGNDPFGMDFTPDGKYLYITNGGSDTVWVVDTTTNIVVKTIPVGNGPHGLAITPNGDYAYVTNFGSHTVTVINIALNKAVGNVIVGSNPQGVAFTPDGKYAYVANFGIGTVSVIETATTNMIATIHVESGPVDITITPDGKHVYVSNSGSGSISVINTETNTVTFTIRGFLQPFDIAITSDGTTAYVANGSGDWISIVNIVTNQIIGKVTVGKGPYGVALTPDDAYAYVVNFYGPTLSIVNLDKTKDPNSTPPPTVTSPPIVSRFLIPALDSSVNFAVDSTYASATLKDNMWIFTDLYIVESSLLFERFEVLTQNTDLTIISCTTVRTLEFQSIKLDYTVNGKGSQVLNFGPPPEKNRHIKWNVIYNNVSLEEGKDWIVSDNNQTITINSTNINGAKVSVNRYYFSDSFDKPELAFIEQHLVTIVIGATLITVLTMAVFIKIKNKEPKKGDPQ